MESNPRPHTQVAAIPPQGPFCFLVRFSAMEKVKKIQPTVFLCRKIFKKNVDGFSRAAASS